MNEDLKPKLNGKSYLPDKTYRENSNLGDYETAYKKFTDNPDKFWSDIAHELIWMNLWDKVCEWKHPYAKWFTNAKLNITYNCLDRHVANSKKNKVALIWRGENELAERVYTYRQLLSLVMRFANALKNLGVEKGDRVCLYMPFIPEHVIAILACARIGAVHNIVYGGFGADALRTRINDSGAKIVITSDVNYRRGKTIMLKSIVDKAIKNSSCVEKVIVLRRSGLNLELVPEKEVDYYEILKAADPVCEPERMDAEDPLFILYTSGTTGKPKGVVHTCAGYMVGTYYTTKYVLDVKDSDIYWCTADPGWITGHSYIVYGPLLTGTTVLISETVPDYPDPGIWWKIVEDVGVSVFYTAPTSIRMFMMYGEQWLKKYDLSSLRVLASVGEPLNPEAFEWFYKNVGKSKCPIADTWWQTETGMHMISTIVGEKMIPGFAGKQLPGVVADVTDKEGNSLPTGKSGHLVIKEPWPSMMRTVYGDEERYIKAWNTVGKYYMTGDLAVKDEEDHIMIIGRSDDVLIIAGHNIGTAEVENAIIEHEAVAEAAVIGKPDPLKGNLIKAFIILKIGYIPTDKLKNDIIYNVRNSLGPIAIPSEIEFVPSLPKTRSGKIMRRILKAKEMGFDPGDLSTIDD
ncbi:MAG: acetate--CoA ligase [Methanocorpusculum sp.]|nr:acetate--CoA ligase [Methanocorpusculum sp.]